MYLVQAYLAYLVISIALTVWVARTLSRNGIVFLIECFGHDELLARSTNHLLVVGFYLVNLGWILLTLRFGSEPQNLAEVLEFLSGKVGLVFERGSKIGTFGPVPGRGVTSGSAFGGVRALHEAP